MRPDEPIPVSRSAARNVAACSSVSGGAFHWLLFLVKSWTVSKPTAWADRTARSQPPAIDMCEPKVRIGRLPYRLRAALAIV